MEERTQIFRVDPVTFEYQTYSSEDNVLISSSRFDTVFSSSTDYIEYCIYDENKSKLFPLGNLKAAESTTYSVIQGDVCLYPQQDLEKHQFNQGNYTVTYNFYRNKLSSSILANYYISDISSDRTELKIKSTTIPITEISSSANDFILEREESDYFVDFLLNFGGDVQCIANNLQVDTDEEGTLLVKLYEPLPSNLDVKSTFWVVEEISSPQAYNVVFAQFAVEEDNIQFISGPNYSLNIVQETGETSQITTFNDLINSDVTSSFEQLNNILSRKEIDININYEDYNEFINFSSANTRLENFVYKVGLIQSSSAVLSSSFGDVEGATTGSTVFSASKAAEENKITKIIKNFDGYEYFLYYNSGSKYSYPKTTTTPPYVLASTSSALAVNWQNQQAVSASNYDELNQNSLYYAIPEYLRSDPDNAKYELFVDMVGQHYDNLWTYTKNLTKKFDGDNRLNYGISKDLVADAIRDFGVKLYANNFNTDDLYAAFLGLTPSGSTFPLPNITSSLPVTSTGFEYVDTKISASNDIVPLDNVNKQLYKRIYHNIPYLLKTKGTISGLKALITSYGIPDTILRISEFGSKDRIKGRDWDLDQFQFNKSYHLDRSTYFSSSFKLNGAGFGSVGNATPKSLQFRFKTIGVPTASLYQNVWAGNNATSLITLEYTGSGFASGSYSGSVTSSNNQYGVLRFYPEGNSDLTVSASISLPFFNNDWWSVQASVYNNTASLLSANRNNLKIGFSASNEVTNVNGNLWNSVTTSSIPSYDALGVNLDGQDYQPLTGSVQEIRYWNQRISESIFYDYVVNPYSVQGNTINSTPNHLTFRADLGTMLQTSSRTSIHPKVTGSWVDLTSSFAGNDSSFYLSDGTKFINNKDFILYNQVPGGIKNRVTDKIQIVSNTIPSGSTLSPFRSVSQTPFASGSDPNINYLEVAFSPTDQVNDDIISQIGSFNLGDYIGDPQQVMQNRLAGQYVTSSMSNYGTNTSAVPDKDKFFYSYDNLDVLRDQYFEKYINSYDVNDFVRLMNFFDNSLFKMIKDFTPARTSLSSGVVVKQNLLERNKYAPPSASYTDETLSGSIKPTSRNYNTGSEYYPQYSFVSGSSIYTYKGGTGGVFDSFNTVFAAPVYYSGSSTLYSGKTTAEVNASELQRIYPEFTQSFTQSVSSSEGNVTVLRRDQREFYDGDFQPNGGAINAKIPEICKAYFGNDNLEDYVYRVQWFFGQDIEGTETYPYSFQTSSTMTEDPGSGKFRLNDSPQNSAITASISNITDGTNQNISSVLLELSSSISKGSIKIENRTDNTQYLVFPIDKVESASTEGAITTRTYLHRYQTGGLGDWADPRSFKLVTLGAQTAATQANFNITGSQFQNYSASFASYLTQVGAGGLDYGQVVFRSASNDGTEFNSAFFTKTITSASYNVGYRTQLELDLPLTVISSSSTNPFSNGNTVVATIEATGSSGDYFTINLGTVASASTASPFSNEENISVSFIPTASFAPVAQQFIKPESFFLDTANCPGDGYAWFWTATNSDGAKAKYIKISNRTANDKLITAYVTRADYITFRLNEARTGGPNSEVLSGYQTWYIANATVMDDGIQATADCSLIITNQGLSSLAVNSNDPLFTNFSFSSSGQFIWYATGSGIDPNVTPALGVTQSSPQGYFPPVDTFPTTQFQKGWATSTWYGNNNGIPTYMGTGSGFLYDPNKNFQTGSKEFDYDDSNLINNEYRRSSYPWYMNASGSQLLFTSSGFNIYQDTSGQFTSSAVNNRFLSESVDFGPEYTVLETETPVEVNVLPSFIFDLNPPVALLNITCPVSLVDLGNTPTITFNNAQRTIPVTTPSVTTQYSSSIQFIDPDRFTATVINFPWCSISSGATGTGSGNIVITAQSGYTGVGTYVNYSREARVNVFQLIDSTYQLVQYCTIGQTYRYESSSGGDGLGEGGIIDPFIPQP